MLELLKLIVQPVVIERNKDGVITGEQVGQAAPLYNEEDVAAYFSSITSELEAANAAEGKSS